MSSSSSSSAATFSLDHLTQSPSEQLCYVHCNFCDTVLAVSVPYTSLFKTVTVRCGHCSNLLSVNMRALHLPPPLPPPPPPSTITQHHQQQLLIHNHCNLLEEISYSPPPPPPLAPHPVTVTPTPAEKTTPLVNNQSNTVKESLTLNKRGEDHQQSSLQQPPAVNRPPEKRQRVPSAYNRFIKEEIQRIKAGNPDITHREAFSAAAKNWAHFPHIHFGLMPDQGLKKNNVRLQDGSDRDVMLKDGFYAAAAAAANMSVTTPF